MISILSRIGSYFKDKYGNCIYVGDKVKPSENYNTLPSQYWTVRHVNEKSGNVFLSFKEEKGGFSTTYGLAMNKYIKYEEPDVA
jgi:hypothetical protein